MSIRLRMRESPKTLCVTCQHSTIVKVGNNRQIVKCAVIDEYMERPVEECTSHEIEGRSKYDFERLAWVLEMRGQKIIGFKPPDPKKYH